MNIIFIPGRILKPVEGFSFKLLPILKLLSKTVVTRWHLLVMPMSWLFTVCCGITKKRLVTTFHLVVITKLLVEDLLTKWPLYLHIWDPLNTNQSILSKFKNQFCNFSY